MTKSKGIIKWVIGAVLLVVLVFFGFTTEVREGENAIITRFGAVRSEVTEAGLYVKLPWPFESVTKYDVRNQYTESAYLETLTKDRKNIILQSYAVWNVSDPVKYHTTVLGDNAVAELYINDLIINASNGILGKYDLTEIVSNDEEHLRLAEIEAALFEHVKEHAVSYGISINEFSVMRLSLAGETLGSVFASMSAERSAKIREIEAQGITGATLIKNEADEKAAATIAEGKAEEARIDALTELEVQKIYAEARGENLELFKFLLELDTVVNSVGDKTTLIVKKDEFLDGLFSKELLDKVAAAQQNNAAQNPGGTEP